MADIKPISSLAVATTVAAGDQIIINKAEGGSYKTSVIIPAQFGPQLGAFLPLNSLSNVSVDNAAIGQVLKWDGTNWVPGTGGGGGSEYVLPVASAVTLGGVRIGSNINVDPAGNGIISVANFVNADTGGTFKAGIAVEGSTSTNSLNVVNDATINGTLDMGGLINFADGQVFPGVSGQVTSVNNQTGAVVLNSEDVGALALDGSNAMTGTLTAQSINASGNISSQLSITASGTVSGAKLTSATTLTTQQGANIGGDLGVQGQLSVAGLTTVDALTVTGALGGAAASFSDQVTIPETPSAATHAASKGYVDSQVIASGSGTVVSVAPGIGLNSSSTEDGFVTGDPITTQGSLFVRAANSTISVTSSGVAAVPSEIEKDITFPVTSVNTLTGAVELTAADVGASPVGALPKTGGEMTGAITFTTSQPVMQEATDTFLPFTGGSMVTDQGGAAGIITFAPGQTFPGSGDVDSVNGQTGVVELDAADIPNALDTSATTQQSMSGNLNFKTAGNPVIIFSDDQTFPSDIDIDPSNLPDATNNQAGITKLSDLTDSTLNAATGNTAATPVAVKTVSDAAAAAQSTATAALPKTGGTISGTLTVDGATTLSTVTADGVDVGDDGLDVTGTTTLRSMVIQGDLQGQYVGLNQGDVTATGKGVFGEGVDADAGSSYIFRGEATGGNKVFQVGTTGDITLGTDLGTAATTTIGVDGSATYGGTVTANKFVGDGSELSGIVIPTPITYKGTIDCTTATAPTPAAGDLYLNLVAGTADASWTGLTTVAQNQFVLYKVVDGTGAWQTGAVLDGSTFVTLSTDQTNISGAKTFTSATTTFQAVSATTVTGSGAVSGSALSTTGDLTVGGNTTLGDATTDTTAAGALSANALTVATTTGLSGALTGTTANFSGQVDVNGTLVVTDIGTSASTVTIANDLVVGDALTVTGAASCSTTLGVTGDLTVGTGGNTVTVDASAGGLTATGNLAAATGTFTGQVTVPLTPDANGSAASKKYVDDQVIASGSGTVVSITPGNGLTSASTQEGFSAGDPITTDGTLTVVASDNTITVAAGGISVNTANLPAAPVTSVNGETGVVVLNAGDVGALSAAGGTLGGSLTVNGLLTAAQSITVTGTATVSDDITSSAGDIISTTGGLTATVGTVTAQSVDISQGGSFGGQLTVPDPTEATSAATKSYVDTAISNIPDGGSVDSVNDIGPDAQGNIELTPADVSAWNSNGNTTFTNPCTVYTGPLSGNALRFYGGTPDANPTLAFRIMTAVNAEEVEFSYPIESREDLNVRKDIVFTQDGKHITFKDAVGNALEFAANTQDADGNPTTDPYIRFATGGTDQVIFLKKLNAVTNEGVEIKELNPVKGSHINLQDGDADSLDIVDQSGDIYQRFNTAAERIEFQMPVTANTVGSTDINVTNINLANTTGVAAAGNINIITASNQALDILDTDGDIYMRFRTIENDEKVQVEKTLTVGNGVTVSTDGTIALNKTVQVGLDAVNLDDGVIIDSITEGGNQGGRIRAYVNQPSVNNKLNIFHVLNGDSTDASNNVDYIQMKANGDATFAGDVTATNFFGDGSNLTGVKSVPVIISATAPTTDLEPGKLWWDSTDGILYVYYTDEDSDSQWVDCRPGAGEIGEVTTALRALKSAAASATTIASLKGAIATALANI